MRQDYTATRYGKRLATALALAAALLLGTLGGGAAYAQDTLKIGYVGGMSGACGALVHYAVNATKLAVEEINAAGGMGGRQVEVIYRDSKTKPDEAAKQMRDLILSEKVELITGPCSSSIFMAVNPIAEQYKIPLFSALSGTHKANVDFGHPYVYQTQPHTLMEGKALAEYAAKQKDWNTVVTMGLDYEWGRTTVKVFTEELQKLRPDVKVATQLWPRIGETNLTSYITAALAEDPDVIMAVMFGGGTVSMIKQGRSYGLLKRTKLLTFLSTEALISLGDQIPEGVHGWARAPFYALDTPQAKEFIEKYRAAYDGEYPADWGVLAYDVMYLIKEGVDRAGGTDPAKLRDALTSFTFQSLRGPLKMRRLDNTLNSPVYLGVTREVSNYPFPIMVNVDRIPGNVVLPSESLVTKLRREAGK